MNGSIEQGKLAGLDQHRVKPVDELSAENARLKRELKDVFTCEIVGYAMIDAAINPSAE